MFGKWRLFFLFLLMAAAIAALAKGQEPPSAQRLPAPVTFFLQSPKMPPEGKEGPVACTIHFHRGRLSLGLKTGDRLLTAAGAYDWDVDQPSLEGDGKAAVFRSGRTDLAPPPVWRTILSTLPRYELWFGLFDREHELRFVQDTGQSELNLAGVRLAGMEIDVKSGRLEARFGENASVCRNFVFSQASGTSTLEGLGGLAAANYVFNVDSGTLQAAFGILREGAALDLALRVSSGTVTLRLPPGFALSARVSIRAGLVYLLGQKCAPGDYEISVGTGERRASLRLEVNSGLVRLL
ncbi:MAG: hypothetical protein GX493_04855 [Firmicutes bacterium]|nr:hypothetical protein [Bacillota bacterium]